MKRKYGSGAVLHGARLLLLAALAGCARQHPGPEVGDSVTNWLAACSDDDECRGDAVCLNSVCSVSCNPPSSATCTGLDRLAICNASARMCDLPCEATSVCRTRGADYVCQDGYCRTREEPPVSAPDASGDSGAQPPTSSNTIPLSIDTVRPTRAAEWNPDTRSPTTQSVFEPAARFGLSDRSTSSNNPFVTWEGDRFRVIWSLDSSGAPGAQLGLADVYPEGRINAWRLDVPATMSLATFKGNGDSVAHVGSVSDSLKTTVCSLIITDLDAAQSNSPWSFPCSSMATAAPLTDSEDWLVVWSPTASATQQEQGMWVARYGPSMAGWSAGPWEIASYEAGTLYGVAAVGEDGWLWPQYLSVDLHRLRGLAEPAPLASTFVPRMDTWATASSNSRHVVAVADGVLAVDSTALGLRTVAISADGSLAGPSEISMSGFPVIGIAGIPELALLAVCVVLHEGVSLLLLDDGGTQVGESILVEPNFQGEDSFDTRVARSCDLAWSGSELLIAWGSVEGAARGTFTPIFMPPPVVYSVQARIMQLPELSSP